MSVHRIRLLRTNVNPFLASEFLTKEAHCIRKTIPRLRGYVSRHLRPEFTTAERRSILHSTRSPTHSFLESSLTSPFGYLSFKTPATPGNHRLHQFKPVDRLSGREQSRVVRRTR